MKARVTTTLDRIRSSYRFVPASMSLLAVLLSILTLYLDWRFTHWSPSDTWWLYGGGGEGARVVLSVIVTSMISVTSVVFSITIATFVYAMLVLRTIRGGDNEEFVPPLAISLGILLVFVSVGVLIYFIHHVATSIQADSVVHSIAVETEDAIERLFPGAIGREGAEGDRTKPWEHNPPKSDRMDLERAHASAIQVIHSFGAERCNRS